MTVGVKTDRELAKETNGKIEKAIRDFRDSFQCQKCGKCCQEGVGVALWAHEFKRLKTLIPNIYKHIKILNENWYALKLPCVFYDQLKKECSIYDKRPIACRLYPLGVNPDGTTRVSQNCTQIKLTTLKDV